MIKGSCLCGGVAFEIDERAIVLINNCHCAQCRKASGAAYGTFLQIATEHFRWLSGEALVSGFESSAGNFRTFCRTCGSRAPTVRANAFVTVPAGVLDGDPLEHVSVHLYVASKATWHHITDDLPAFAGRGDETFWRHTLERARQVSDRLTKK